ncbi:putative QWRF family protein [Helianthus annuus]|uniref:QWRF family protein n=2 Tax=Helianthus annuus TaxID=4232 RepID=A0A9K3I8U1_HELAN|nr:putative QWRF family protein [Helianthus annuus]KAJ0527206.1 putative QWRF family protein [Helianthus annuus]KAJ0535869.1 putative QWRF family protein [Helianthus annuus]KAJ0543610.1 putative QWRF family protein [Helianthus annuus]KAJ0708665.1 putative QWRF family protein [Helianthus annuus]
MLSKSPLNPLLLSSAQSSHRRYVTVTSPTASSLGCDTMVANVSSVTPNRNPKVPSRAPSPAKPKRSPLVPSETDNNVSLPRRPKSRDVTSRYLSSTASSASNATTMTSTSSSGSFSSTTTTSSSNSMCTPRRRFPSPLVSSTNLMTPKTSSTMSNKRAQSTERRRPATPQSVTAKMLTAMPARSLSVSFQGPSFAIPASKSSKPPPVVNNNGSRNCTPERRPVTPVRKLANPNSIDQKRWPATARSRQGGFMTRSVDLTNENVNLSGSGTATAVRALQKSMIGESKLKGNKPEVLEVSKSIDKLFSEFDNADRVNSDAESVSSGSTPGIVRGATPRGITVPARFRQETVNRLRRVEPEPVSPPLSRNNRPLSANRYLKDGPARTPRGLSPSPIRGAVRPASPCKSVLGSAPSPSRGMSSPTRPRSAAGSNSNLGNTHSILSFAADTRRRKVGDNAITDAHELRLLHNKYLQWRFGNARADAAMMVQRATAQKSLYNSWVTTSKMRQSVISKQMEIQQLRQNLMLHTLLQTQIPYLKVWDQVERDHIVSLSGAIASLESSTLRVPLVEGAKVDVQSLKDAIRSAADVMQTMTSLIRSLVTKVEHVTTLASELATTTTNERSTIDRCKDLFSILANMEVQDCSLRTHLLQLQQPPPTAITEL